MVRIEWTLIARNDLKSIAEYISVGSKQYAKIEVAKIRKKPFILKSFKGIGRIVPEVNRKEIRELIQGNYRIIYKIVSVSHIDILTIRHASRKFTKEHFENL